MITTHTSRGLVWLDLQSPTEEEIGSLVQRYGLHPLVGEELKSSPSLAKIEFYKDYALVVLTLPVRVKEGGEYLEDAKLSGMTGDFARLIRRYPIPAALIGIGLSWFAWRKLKS